MSLSLDHVVIAVADLDRAKADWEALGFTVLRGGEHANGITHNMLVVFADGAYLELIAWKRPDPGHRWSDVFHSSGEGFLDYALLPTDIAADVAAAQARGLDIADPEPGGRHRPDGQRLEWRTARCPGSDLPFLCGDVTSRALRVPDGEVRRHPNGVTGVAELTVAVHDLDLSLNRMAALLGAGEGAARASEEIAGDPARAAALPLGNGTILRMASPAGPSGPVGTALALRGQGPFAIAFRGPSRVALLDSSLTHGARASIVS